MEQPSPATVAALLQWYLAAGVDETIGEQPIDRYVAPSRRAGPDPLQSPQGAVAAPPPPLPPVGIDGTAAAARAGTLDELRQELERFEDCPLKHGATRLVFGRGHPHAPVVLIGEAPGYEEDIQGLPFVGPSGRLLDRMLASIGLDEGNVWISNTVFWRPPANRAPTTSETAACMPFLRRMIGIVRPRLLVALGGPAAAALLGRPEAVGRLRGRWFDYSDTALTRTIPATATFHPAYLLRSPAQKRLAWRDFLSIASKLDEIG